MSEGTPGHGPDADSRTDTEGQAPTNGRPAVPPVRYGPRNGNGVNGRGGSNGRTAPGQASPQQYRAPQPPRAPADGASTNGSGTNGSGANGSGTNGSATNGSATNGSVTNGSGSSGAAAYGATAPGSRGPGPSGTTSNGAHPATPNPYARPRPNGTPARPEPSEQERLVAEARTAAAARNASAAKVRGGSALTGTRSPAAPTTPTAPADETAVIPAVTRDEPKAAAPVPADTSGPSTATSDETVTPDKARNVLGRLRDGRDRRTPKDAAAPEAATVVPEVPTSSAQPVDAPEPQLSAGSEVVTAPEAADQESATEPRRLTWRDRLGLAPKEAKPQPADAPQADAEVSDAPAGTAAPAATAVTWAPPTEAEVAPTESKVGPVDPDKQAQPEQPTDRVTPIPLVPATTSDTVVIPAVDGAAVPSGAAATSPVAAPAKPKVGAARRTRKARLRLSRVDPWSVMKTALLFSIAAGIILVVATYGVWSVLNASGLFDAVNDMVKSVVSTPGDTTPFRIEEYVNTQKIIGVAALIAVVDVLIFTALATLGSFLYNLAATVLGGLEVTLAED